MRYLVFALGFKKNECNIILFGESSGLSRDIFKAHLWLIDAWNHFRHDPEGFRTAYKLAGKIKCLLLFYKVPDGFPEEGEFWCNPLSCNLEQKIKEVLEKPPPHKTDFEALIQIWPELGKTSGHHHHHH